MPKSTDTIEEEAEDKSTEEVDEETQDESEEDKESEESEGTETDEEDEDSEDSEDSDESEESDEETFEKRFTQLKGDTLEEYKDSLEEAYRESSTEAKRIVDLNKDLTAKLDNINRVIAQNPELAEKLAKDIDVKTPETVEDPAIETLKGELLARQKKEWDDFLSEKKELGFDLEFDEGLSAELVDNLALVRDQVRMKENRQVGMEEGLRKAWKMLDIDEPDPKEDKVRNALKGAAGKGRSGGKKKVKAPGPELTDAQKKIADKWGLDQKKVAEHIET